MAPTYRDSIGHGQKILQTKCVTVADVYSVVRPTMAASEHAQASFLSLLPEQCIITAAYTAFTLDEALEAI